MKQQIYAPLLQAEGLTKEFRQGKNRILAVNGLSLEIRRGEIFGLVGESGCGKTTLGHMLIGLSQPTAGRVLFHGEDVTAPGKKRLRELCRARQIVFQDPYGSIDTGKTVGWLLEEPLKIHRLGDRARRQQRIVTMLEAVGLDKSYVNRWPDELSGGQRQRVAIALSLILEPELLVCDEPVSALDVSIQAQVLDLLLDLRSSFGLTYLFISHDLNVVSYLSDRVGVMYLGALVELGPADLIARDPLHPYTRALFSASPGMGGGPRVLLSGDPPSPADPPAGCPFHTRCHNCTKKCTVEKPLLRTLPDGRSVACHCV